jgi:hypothetical protein
MHRSERPFGSCIPTGARDSARKEKGAGSSSALASARPSDLLVIESKDFLNAR